MGPRVSYLLGKNTITEPHTLLVLDFILDIVNMKLRMIIVIR